MSEYYYKQGFLIVGLHNIPADAVKITSVYHQELLAKQALGYTIEPDASGYPVAVPPPAPTLEEKQAMIVSAVQARLDAFAQTRGYDNILSAASYVTSTNPKFAAEGQYAVEVRDLTWANCWRIFAEFMGGQRPEPTLDEIMAELPPLEWPEV